MTNFITFGDSWPAGAELQKDERVFGDLIAEKLGFNFHNYAVQATSNDHLIMQLLDYLDKDYKTADRHVALFFITDLHRSIWFDEHNCPRELHHEHRFPANKAYFKHIHSKYLEDFRFITAMNALRHLCAEYDIEDHYVVGWERLNDFRISPTGVPFERFYDHGHTTIVEATIGDTHRLPYGHPDQIGHQMIADELYKWLSQNI